MNQSGSVIMKSSFRCETCGKLATETIYGPFIIHPRDCPKFDPFSPRNEPVEFKPEGVQVPIQSFALREALQVVLTRELPEPNPNHWHFELADKIVRLALPELDSLIWTSGPSPWQVQRAIDIFGPDQVGFWGWPTP
jgi:hypothetical protein